jgi:predicted RNA-binding protein with PIN domain
MKTFVLDGYNVIHALPEFSLKLKENLAAARESLARYIFLWKRRYPDADVCIVFDGQNRDEFDYPRSTISGIDCRFTESREGADEKIISMVRDSEDPNSMIIISNDRSIRTSCRAQGARVESTDFLV